MVVEISWPTATKVVWSGWSSNSWPLDRSQITYLTMLFTGVSGLAIRTDPPNLTLLFTGVSALANRTDPPIWHFYSLGYQAWLSELTPNPTLLFTGVSGLAIRTDSPIWHCYSTGVSGLVIRTDPPNLTLLFHWGIRTDFLLKLQSNHGSCL